MQSSQGCTIIYVLLHNFTLAYKYILTFSTTLGGSKHSFLFEAFILMTSEKDILNKIETYHIIDEITLHRILIINELFLVILTLTNYVN